MEEYTYINSICDISNILNVINEAFESSKHLEISLLDEEKFIKANNIQEVSDPVFFVKDGIPTEKGLLSYEIFGITKEERTNIYGYIDLGGWFMDPLCYILWSRMDRRIKDIIHGTKTFSINSSGDFVEDPEGDNGVEFLKNNIDKIKIKPTESFRRVEHIKFLYKHRERMFLRKYIVIPPFYRDVNSSSGTARGVGQLNKYYSNLLISVKSLKETAEYGISLSTAIRGRIQELLVSIYNCLCGTGNSNDGPGLAKKEGYFRNAVTSKTADYGTRLILSAPELKGERVSDLMVDIDHSALPLGSALVNFKPYIKFFLRRFFDNEFGGLSLYTGVNSKGEIVTTKVKDPRIVFSDEEFDKQINRFIHGFSNRFIPIEVPLEDGRYAYAVYKGKEVDPDTMLEKYPNSDITKIDPNSTTLRRLTWCDVLYMAAVEASRDKHILITRYPMDSCYNQFPSKVRISSTNKTIPVVMNNTLYRWYPYIREKDIGSNTSNSFVDTLNISNLHLKSIGGDYDGDQVSVKGVFSVEANEECDAYLNSNASLINFGGSAAKMSTNEAIQSLYNLTKVLNQDKDKLTNPVF